MKLIRCKEYGPPSGMTLEEAETPALRNHEVLIETEAAGLGYVDALLVAGTYQVKMPLPFIPGSEVAGLVIETGSDAPSSLKGKRVMALSSAGALAEKIALPAPSCIPIPDNMSADAAAGFIISYCTALYGFDTCGKLRAGERVLVLGAAGGVGMAAIDVAKAMGAIVIAAASTPEKREAALARGADFAIDYTDPEWRKKLDDTTGKASVNLVYDPVGGDFSETALRSLAPGGRHLVVGFANGSIPKISLNLVLLKRCHITGVDWGGFIRANPQDNMPLMQKLLGWVEEGKITPEPSAAYSLEEAPNVLQALLDRKSVGKPIISFKK